MMPLQHSPKCTALSSSENDITTVNSNLQSQESTSTPNINLRKNKRARLSEDDTEDVLDAFKKDIKQMLNDVFSQQNLRLNTLEKHMTDIMEKNNQDMGNTLNFMSDQIAATQAQISRLENDRKTTSLEIQVLNDKIDNLERNMRKTSLELRNIPRKPKENKSDLFNLVQELFKSLNIESAQSEIKDVYRLPRKSDTNNTTMVIVELSSTLTRAKVLEAIKMFSKNRNAEPLYSTHMGITSPKLPIYVSEYLSPKTKRIHFLARDFSKTEQYKFCWVSNGNVFLRKDENSPHVLVKNEEVLSSLKKKATNA